MHLNVFFCIIRLDNCVIRLDTYVVKHDHKFLIKMSAHSDNICKLTISLIILHAKIFL